MARPIQSAYRPDIDGLRAVAVLSVMAYHLNNTWLPGGFVGVDVFFVISGFVVASSLIAGPAESFPNFLSDFYARRLARILPALVLVLIFSSLMATLFIPQAWLSELSEKTARAAFFGLSNLVLQKNTDVYFAPRAEFNPYTHTWSLSVEEQYYLLAPLFVYFWLRAYRNDRSINAHVAIGVLVLVMIASLVVCIRASSSLPIFAFYSIFSRLWELAVGALLFLLTCANPSWLGTGQAGWRVITASLGLIGIAVGLIYAESTGFPWPWALLPVVGTMFLIGGATLRPDDAVRRVLTAPVMVWVGKRSYSLYLWHWPVFVLMRWTVGLNTAALFAAAVVITFCAATVSYRFVEQPLRHNATLEGRANWVRITAFIAMPAMGISLAKHLFNHKERYSLSTVARSSVDWYVSERMPYSNIGDRKCTVVVEYHDIAGGQERRYVPQCPDNKIKKSVFVLGDSHATMLAPAFDQLSGEEGVQVNIFSYGGCPFLDFIGPMDVTSRSAECLEFTRVVTQQTLNAASPGDTVLLSSLRMHRYGDQWASFNVPDMYDVMYGSEAMGRRLAAIEDAKSWLQLFADKQLKVVFTAPTPIFKAPTFRCSDWFNATNPICIGNNQQTRPELERLRQPIINVMHALGREFQNVTVWDAFPVLCPDDICRTQKDGRPLFFDGDHLSAYGNLTIYPSFKQLIMQ